MKMTTEEAFIKVLQRHGFEHAFGIIGSTMMPVSDLFPAAGIKFWDCAHEGNAGMCADGFTRATGMMCMVIAQNGPGITNLVTPVMTTPLGAAPRPSRGAPARAMIDAQWGSDAEPFRKLLVTTRET